MAQFLRPDGVILTDPTITVVGAADESAAVNETSRNDSTHYKSEDTVSGAVQLSLSSPTSTPASGTCTVRYTHTQVDGGVINSTGGTASTIDFQIVEGGSVIASSGEITTQEGSWGAGSFTFNTSVVTNWANIELHTAIAGSGGAPANRRGAAVSWLEVEVPDPPVAPTRRRTLRVS